MIDRWKETVATREKEQARYRCSKNCSSVKVLKSDDCFSFQVEQSLLHFKEGKVPTNTAKNTKRAVRNFESWRIAKNERCLIEAGQDHRKRERPKWHWQSRF